MKKRLLAEKRASGEEVKIAKKGRPPEHKRIVWKKIIERLDFCIVPKGTRPRVEHNTAEIIDAFVEQEDDVISQPDGIAIAIDLWKKKTPGLIKLDVRQHDCTARDTCSQVQLMVSCMFWTVERKCSICVYYWKDEKWYPICEHKHPGQNKMTRKWSTTFVYVCTLTGAAHICGPKCNISVFTGDQCATCPLTGHIDINNRKMKHAFHPGASEEFSANHEFGSKRTPPTIDDILDIWIPVLMDAKTLAEITYVVTTELANIQQSNSITSHIVIASGEMWKLFCEERYATERLLFQSLLSNAREEAVKVIRSKPSGHAPDLDEIQLAFDGQFVGYAHTEFVEYKHLKNLIHTTVLKVIQYWIEMIKQRKAGMSVFKKQVGFRESVIPIIYTMAFGYTTPSGVVIVPSSVFLAQILPTYRILHMYNHSALAWDQSVLGELRICFMVDQHNFVASNKTYLDLPHTIPYVPSKKTLQSLCVRPTQYIAF